MKFERFLKNLVDSQKYRLVDLSESSGVHSSDLSKIINSKRPCGQRLMTQIVLGLRDEHQAQALIAWLTDQIPPELQSLVLIVRAGSSVVREEPADASTLEGALKLLGQHAETNEAVQVVLLNMAKAFQSTRKAAAPALPA